MGIFQGRRIGLIQSDNHRRFYSIYLLCLMILLALSGLNGAESASLRGEVLHESGNSFPEARIFLESRTDPAFSRQLKLDEKGRFFLTGLDPGSYSLTVEIPGYAPLRDKPIELTQGRLSKIFVTLAPSDGETRTLFIPLDETQVVQDTLLDSHAIHELPSAHNLWALVENQDLSATTNRIDVGGLWSGIPALFSARGGTSWTQTVYLLNGLDVTDPYQTGLPLFYPDYASLDRTRLINGGAPASVSTPGGQLDITPRAGRDDYHGELSAFYIHNSLQGDNLTSELESEGLYESHRFDYYLDGNLQISGPLVPGRVTGYASVSAFDLSRDPAEYADPQKTNLLSSLANLTFRLPGSRLHVLYTGQKLDHPAYGTGRQVPFSATTDRKERYQVFQALWKLDPHPRHAFEVGISSSRGNVTEDFQSGADRPYAVEIFSGLLSGGPAQAADQTRDNLHFRASGESLIPGVRDSLHRIRYGVSFQRVAARTAETVRDGLHLHYYNGLPLEIVFLRPEIEHRETGRFWKAYLQDSMTLSCGVTLYFGAQIDWSRASAEPAVSGDPGPEIEWRHIAPRAGIIIPLNRKRTSLLKIAFGRFYYSLPLHYLTYGHPDAQGSLVYAWNDLNGDTLYQSGEEGRLLRREGPFYGEISSDIQRPFTDEFLLSYAAAFGSGWTFSLSGFGRRTGNLVRSLNTGVSFDEYEPVYVTDSGDDRIPYSYDDLLFTVFNQNPDSFGQDFFSLCNIPNDTRDTVYYGFDLNLLKRFGKKLTFFLSLTATQAEGAGNPGNSEWENDDGVIGSLFHSPNNLINAEGRLRFDRAYTGRLGLHWRAPLGFNLGCVIKYYDGIPFTRKIIIEGLNQGPMYIQAHARGVARYEYNRTIDIRIEKIWTRGRHRWSLFLDGFNIANLHQATEENEWTGPDFPLRFATEIQSPRVFRIGLRYVY